MPKKRHDISHHFARESKIMLAIPAALVVVAVIAALVVPLLLNWYGAR